MDYEPLSLAADNKADRASTGDVAGATKLKFKIFKDNYTKDFFLMEMDEEETKEVSDLLGTRLSGQLVNDNYERRYYGTSLYYCNPDMVITVQLRVKSTSPGQSEPSVKLYRLRYVPKIVFINAADVPAIYQQMKAKANGGMSSGVDYATLNQHLNLVKAYADEISFQLSK